MEWKDYFFADTYNEETGQGVLKNKLGIKDDAELSDAEARRVALNTSLIIDLSFNIEGLKQVHKHLFGDIYDWAGEFRGVAMGKGTGNFTMPPLIEKELEYIFTELNKKKALVGLDQNSFISNIAIFFGSVNAVHPFREGNGRTQRYFFSRVAEKAGYELDFQNITKERMIDASISSGQSNIEPLKHLFLDAIDKDKIELLKPVVQFFKANDSEWQERIISSALPGQTYEGTFFGCTKDKEFAMQAKNGHVIVGEYKHLNQPPAGLKPGDKIRVDIPSFSQKQSNGLKA